MKKILAFALGCALAVGCSDSKQTLYVYNWAEYIDPELIEQFSAEQNCKVVIDTFDSNEAALAKLLAGAAGYDVVFPTSYIVPTMVRNGLLAELSTNDLPNVIANFDHAYDAFIDDSEFKWSVPYAFGMTGIGWRSDKVTLPENVSWSVLTNQLSNRIGLLDDIREMLGIGLKVNGFSINSTNKVELDQAVETIIAWKKCAAKLDNVQYRTALVSGEMHMSLGYNSDMIQIREESSDTPIKFAIPVEGSTCCFDTIVVMKNGKKELACKFIDFLYRPENAAKNMKYICSAMPNAGMKKFLAKEDLENELMFPSESILKRLEVERAIDESYDLWSSAWDKFKAAR